MNQLVRKIHLWVGLILAVLILIEAVTGLILAEPWLVGQDKTQRPQVEQSQRTEQLNKPGDKNAAPGGQFATMDKKPAASSAFGLAKGLHQGKLGTLNLKWLASLTAIGLIILTLTGLYIAIPLLKARRRNR